MPERTDASLHFQQPECPRPPPLDVGGRSLGRGGKTDIDMHSCQGIHRSILSFMQNKPGKACVACAWCSGAWQQE